MKQPAFLYPATPINVPPSITEPSTTFKKEVSGVMGSIIFFLIVYLLLLLLSAGLVIGSVYAGIAMIVNFPKFITIFAGLGLIGVGVMVFIFLVKFMFAVSRYDRSGIVEVTEEDQPELFAFIRQLTIDTQTPFPKRIYLSADVNACVFYDSSFWSMFFPVKKNLQIGIGLVNALNLSEFKAVMAHEFGHFSQRSMKLGSFVYNVNRIIHNMLFENRSYSEFLQGWANLDGIFAFFASLTARIAQGIQWILRQMYGLINKSYMGLSREMEFHADAVAASVSGSSPLVSALRRIEFAHSAYQLALEKCDQLYRENKLSGNFYTNQSAMLVHMANEFKLSVSNGLPMMNDEFVNRSDLSRVNFKDQWASHPTTNDREAHLKQLGVVAEIREESAWVIFRDKEVVEKALTDKMFENVTRKDDTILFTDKEFEEKLQSDTVRYSFPEVYNGFFDARQIAIPEPTNGHLPSTDRNFETIFSATNTLLPKKISAITNDIAILHAIVNNGIETKTFDFDGEKYSHHQAKEVLAQLEQELKSMQEELAILDREVIGYFYQEAGKKGDVQLVELKESYNIYYGHRREAERFLKCINGMMEPVNTIFSGATATIEEISELISDLKNDHEPAFKKELQLWIDKGLFNDQPDLQKKLAKFIASDFTYFNNNSFFEEEFLELNSVCTESWSAVQGRSVDMFKGILEGQLRFVG
jgi:Zn-dependent protease with chaperone function